jgi:hypothetical protein
MRRYCSLGVKAFAAQFRATHWRIGYRPVAGSTSQLRDTVYVIGSVCDYVVAENSVALPVRSRWSLYRLCRSVCEMDFPFTTCVLDDCLNKIEPMDNGCRRVLRISHPVAELSHIGESERSHAQTADFISSTTFKCPRSLSAPRLNSCRLMPVDESAISVQKHEGRTIKIG